MGSMQFLRLILLLSSFLLTTKAFSVLVGAAATCSPLTVSWTGGQSPFVIYIFPANYSSSFYNVPSSAYNGNQGSYTIPQLPLPQGQQFALTMSDGTGFATGGTTDLIQVAASTSSSSCNTATSLGFTFVEASSSLQQCLPYIFNGYQGAILPATIVGIIPGGESFLIQSGVTTTSYTWTVDVQAGTSIMFAMWDTNGNSGGCAELQSVGPSNDASCLSSSSPSSTISIPQSSQSGSSSPSTTAPSTTSPSTIQTGSSSPSILSSATIAGVVGGGVVALAALVIFGLCLVRRRNRNDSRHSVPTPHNAPPLHWEDLHQGPDTSMTAHIYPLQHQSGHLQSFVPSSGQTIPRMTYGSHRGSTSLPQDSSADATGVLPVPSFIGPMTHNIVHTDVERAPSTALQAIDLPPQYSERPGPAAGQSSVSRPLSSGADLARVPKSFDQTPRYLRYHPPP
ncbi:hypothetical protein F5J12DRAFT_270215 [Pisolithus orientalis]|uniref:uncharacterized protein n=1 Tax=Pisolithus orientalis TaxID=936130 RepID=UPI002224862C|nr:uncharacterized protein F5J12DRAFT_270215 [Pisolithus orientalis]KAI5999853.1 hypothetical protein F5J12DRAFT_270215 [Pisolithus orientalis]